MILAYKHITPDAHDAEPVWVQLGELEDETALAHWGDGTYRIYKPTKGAVGEGPEAANDTPKGWTFDRDVTLSLPEPPAPKIESVG